MKIPFRAIRLFAAFLSVSATSACVSSHHALVATRPAPAAPNEAHEAAGDIARVAVLQLIVHHGPGSWKRDAYWDEYVVAIESTTPVAVRVVSVRLIAADGRRVEPGRDWRRLDRESRPMTWGERVTAVVAEGGKNTLAAVAGGTGLVLSRQLMAGGPTLLATMGPVALAPMAAAALIVGPAAVQEAPVTWEFVRRNLLLPARVAPGAPLRRSLFFPPTPGAVALEFTLSGAAGLETLALDLESLGGIARPDLE